LQDGMTLNDQDEVDFEVKNTERGQQAINVTVPQ